MDPREHWEGIYRAKGAEEVSWFQPVAALSLELIERALPARDAAILDVGGGASTLVDGLLAMGRSRLTVLDLSRAALEHAQRRLGASAARVAWLEADVLAAELTEGSVDLWHDRAVFHFLTDPARRARYVEQVRKAVRPEGHVLVATFAADGPTRCSGLEVARYSTRMLHGQFGEDFRVVESRREEHRTPWGALQAFTYCLCRFEPRAGSRRAA